MSDKTPTATAAYMVAVPREDGNLPGLHKGLPAGPASAHDVGLFLNEAAAFKFADEGGEVKVYELRVRVVRKLESPGSDAEVLSDEEQAAEAAEERKQITRTRNYGAYLFGWATLTSHGGPPWMDLKDNHRIGGATPEMLAAWAQGVYDSRKYNGVRALPQVEECIQDLLIGTEPTRGQLMEQLSALNEKLGDALYKNQGLGTRLEDAVKLLQRVPIEYMQGNRGFIDADDLQKWRDNITACLSGGSYAPPAE